LDRFAGQVAAITGAGSGIGRSLAINLAEKGCRLALADINADGLEETARLVAGAECSTHVIDVSAREAVENFAAEVVDRHGGIQLVINNAGVALVDSVENMNFGDFEWVMNINFWGVVYGTKAFLPYMQQAGAGHIVNISSLFGLMAAPLQSAYNASKFAVRGFTEALRIEMMGSPINISCVHPGGIKTSIVEKARYAEDSTAISKDELGEWFDEKATLSADDAAKAIIRGVAKNKKRILVGFDARVADKLVRIFPASYEERVGLAREVRERMVPPGK